MLMQPGDQHSYWQPADEPDENQDTPAPIEDAPAEKTPPEPQPKEEPKPGRGEPIHWTALEQIPQERNALWFVGFVIVTLLLMAVAVFLVKSVSFAAVTAVAAAAIIVYTRRPPREIAYTLSQKGLYVGDRLYILSDYKAFGVIKDGREFSIMLIPTKRFMPGLVVYFPYEAGEKIVDSLGQRLPMQQLELDFVDRIVRKLRL